MSPVSNAERIWMTQDLLTELCYDEFLLGRIFEGSFLMLSATALEKTKAFQVLQDILHHVRRGEPIRLPEFDPSLEKSSGEFATPIVGLEDNPYFGTVGEFRYQFEGEEDLLHLIVVRSNGLALTVEEAQTVCAFVLPNVSPGLIWLRPGEFSQHFYVGHDELLGQAR